MTCSHLVGEYLQVTHTSPFSCMKLHVTPYT